MENLLQKLMLGSSAAALLAISPISGAYAQGDSDIEQVVVSASRISIAGYTQPTPVTVIGAAALEAAAFVDLGDAIRQLPALGTSASPGNGTNAGAAAQGYAGIDTVSLRQLGASRTLVLFDGQRVVGSNPQGSEVDLSTIPTAIIERVDVVTGGASAAWGSDAVSGVVNLIINKNFDGFKANVEAGQNAVNTHMQFRTDLSEGTDILGGRGHIVVSGSYIMSPQATFTNQNAWFRPVTLMPSSILYPGVAGLPTYSHTTGPIGSTAYTTGGLITSGPLIGTQFVGPNGTPTPFFFGKSFAGLCQDCSATPLGHLLPIQLTSAPYHATTLFAYGKYKLTDTIQASIQVNVGLNTENNINSNRVSTNTIKSDNPYIPSATKAQMTALGLTSIPVSTNNLGNIDPLHPSIRELKARMIADGGNESNRLMLRGVFTLEGTLGSDWGWQAYVQHGQVREREKEPENALSQNYTNAVDAVLVTTANRGTSGLPLSTIACRSTLTNPTDGCQPFNTFGTGGYTQAVIDYIDPGRTNPAKKDTALWIMSQSVIAASMQGTLPWELPAGKVGAAFGAEYHHQLQRNIADPLGLGPIAGWSNGNFSQFDGQYNVYEAFAEVEAPILKNNIVQSLDINAAGRITDYSTSGIVETWKVGLTSQVNDDIRVRTTWSTDIRAPNIYELFSPPQYNRGTQIDPKTGKNVNAYGANQGNINLHPEVATTVSGGLVLTPQFIPGLSTSFDWYSIVIKGAVFAVGGQQAIGQCQAGLQIYCNNIYYGAAAVAIIPTFAPDYPGALGLIVAAPLNAASETTSGLDFQADYPMDLFTGKLNWHLVGNYTDEYTRTNLGLTYDGAGALSGSAPLTGNVKFHLTLAATYNDGPWSATVQGRLLGEGALNNYWKSGVDVDNNIVPFVGYLDLRASYKWNDHIGLYGSINNFTNTPPPSIPSAVGGQGTNLQVYDGIGRMVHVGVRLNY